MAEFSPLGAPRRGGGIVFPHLAFGEVAIKYFFADSDDAATRTNAMLSEPSGLQEISNRLFRYAQSLGGFFNRHHGFTNTR